MLSMYEYVGPEQQNRKEILPFVKFACNIIKQKTTGFTHFLFTAWARVRYDFGHNVPILH